MDSEIHYFTKFISFFNVIDRRKKRRNENTKIHFLRKEQEKVKRILGNIKWRKKKSKRKITKAIS